MKYVVYKPRERDMCEGLKFKAKVHWGYSSGCMWSARRRAVADTDGGPMSILGGGLE